MFPEKKSKTKNCKTKICNRQEAVNFFVIYFILLRFIATNQQKHIIMKKEQNDKQLELPGRSRLVRRQFNENLL